MIRLIAWDDETKNDQADAHDHDRDIPRVISALAPPFLTGRDALAHAPPDREPADPAAGLPPRVQEGRVPGQRRDPAGGGAGMVMMMMRRMMMVMVMMMITMNSRMV
jgi:hypothetical protein